MKYLLFIGALLLVTNTVVTAQDDEFAAEKESYIGTIGTYDIVMNLEFRPDGQGGVFYSGTYYYESQGPEKTIALDGAMGEYGLMKLYERDPKTNKISATFELTSPEFGQLEGTWTSAKGKEYPVFLKDAELPLDEEDKDYEDIPMD